MTGGDVPGAGKAFCFGRRGGGQKTNNVTTGGGGAKTSANESALLGPWTRYPHTPTTPGPLQSCPLWQR